MTTLLLDVAPAFGAERSRKLDATAAHVILRLETRMSSGGPLLSIQRTTSDTSLSSMLVLPQDALEPVAMALTSAVMSFLPHEAAELAVNAMATALSPRDGADEVELPFRAAQVLKWASAARHQSGRSMDGQAITETIILASVGPSTLNAAPVRAIRMTADLRGGYHLDGAERGYRERVFVRIEGLMSSKDARPVETFCEVTPSLAFQLAGGILTHYARHATLEQVTAVRRALSALVLPSRDAADENLPAPGAFR